MASIKLKGDTSGELTIQAPSVAGTNTLDLPASSGTLLTTTGNGSQLTGLPNSYAGTKNLIINGDMRIDQRNGGSEINPVANNTYSVDRWNLRSGTTSLFKSQQNAGSVTPPEDFTNYLGITSLSSHTVGASEISDIRQGIEGQNIAHLKWGTADAKTVTVSFWVRSSLTGTFGASLSNTSANRCYPFSYSITSANTWEKKTITIAGDTTGTWSTDNTIGIRITFSLGTGTTYSGTSGAWTSSLHLSVPGETSVVGTSGATFYITGVQLEVSTEATPFEHRPYDMELARCLRYFERYDNTTINTSGGMPQGIATVDVANRPEINLFYTRKRTNPTITGSSAVTCKTMANTLSTTTAGPFTYVGTSVYGTNLFYNVSSGVSVNSLSGINYILLGAGDYINIDAEL